MSVFFRIKAHCDVEPDKYSRLQMWSGEIWFCRPDNIHTGKNIYDNGLCSLKYHPRTAVLKCVCFIKPNDY